jgi:hypothetical protein
MMSEQLLTRYFVYETNDDGATLMLVGEELARSSQDALKAYFRAPPPREGTFVAVSENARRLRHVKTEMRATITEAVEAPEEVLEPPVELVPGPDLTVDHRDQMASMVDVDA